MGQQREGIRVEGKSGCEAVPGTASSDSPGTSAAEVAFRIAPTRRPLHPHVSLSSDVGCPQREHDLSSPQPRQFCVVPPAAGAVSPPFLKGALAARAGHHVGSPRTLAALTENCSLEWHWVPDLGLHHRVRLELQHLFKK